MLVEREENLARLRECLAGRMAGRGQVVVVTGPPATGKTILMRTISKEIIESGMILHAATASAAEQDRPFGVLRQLFPGLFTGDWAAPPGQQRHDWQPVFDLLSDEAAGRPVVVTVDDAQHADLPSLEGLLYLVRRLGSLPVLLMLNESVGAFALPTRFRVELLRQPWVARMRLAPISSDGVASLLNAEIGSSAAADAAMLKAMTGGNPLLVSALIEDSAAGGQVIRPGEAFEHAVLTCVSAGGHETAEVARALAVLGTAASPVTVAGLVDLPIETVARVVRLLTEAGLVVDGRLRHPALCCAILQNVDLAHRASLHARAAQTLHDEGHDARSVASHVVPSNLERTPWMVSVLVRAAAGARVVGDYEFALRCVQCALNAVEGDRERAVLLADQLKVQWDINPKSARRLLSGVVAVAGHLGPADLGFLVRSLVWYGRMDEATEVLGRLGAALDWFDDQELAEVRSIRLWLRMWCPALLDRFGAEQLRRQRTATTGRPLTARPPTAEPLDPLGDLGTALRRAEDVLGSTTFGAVSLPALQNALLTMVYAGRADLAADWAERLIAKVGSAATRAAVLLNVRAEIALRVGDLPDAIGYARDALRRISPEGWGAGIGAPLAVLVCAHSLLGEVDAAAEWLAHEVPDYLYETTFGLMYLRARGVLQLAVGRPRAALRSFLQCGELAISWKLDLPGIVPWRTDAAQAYLELGEAGRVSQLVREHFEARGGGGRMRATGLRLMAAATEGRQSLTLLRESIELAEAVRDWVELVSGLIALGERLCEVGELDKASALVSRAKSVAEEHGLRPLSERLLDRVDVGQAPDEHIPEAAEALLRLSDAERRVANLAALGSTNREISRKLHITVSTVEQHLTRIFRKLNVRRRSELRRVLKTDTADIALASCH
ncbi:regulatory protein, luxR family [Amycolatopsis australiensis]|uniref:Regulatory protein, luxR family n=2 Tax=Amycolatopsis australiensis TaxID=546364 RepID=A0A1K1SW78_9PSEU|nr:AAA family ATPase [Amycolatopsis australiensis]SFW88586.1 regulatory protein, luxR family [Amycolatopsis australiensis]